ncbi:MAG TPA: MFS transporter [Geminicoccaceae bacterium]|nr:MFS transporter [Geminicoccaceae bacterium]
MSRLLPVLGAAVLLQTAAAMSSNALPVLGPELTSAVGLPAETVGLFSSLTAVGTMWFMLVSGKALPRIGPVRTLQLGMLVCAAALAAATAGIGAVALAAAVVIGFGYGPTAPASSEVLARLAPPRRAALVFSIKQAAAPLGGAIVGLLVPFVAVRLGWQAALLAVAAPVVLAGILVQPLRAGLDAGRDPRRPLSPRDLVALSSLRRPVDSMRLSPALPPLTAAGVAFAVLQGSTFAFLVTYLVERVGFGLEAAGAAFTALQALGMIARVVAGWLAGPVFDPRRVLAFTAIASVATTLVVAAFDPGWPVWLVVLVCAVDGVAVAGWTGVYLAEVARAAPAGRVADATAGSTFFVFIGYVLGPAAFGGLVALTGSYALAFAAAALLVLAAGVRLALRDPLAEAAAPREAAPPERRPGGTAAPD